ncbi:MAG: hypothetical protein K9G11_00280 [Rickettsiaceae bacterium]|nr:hypothetical protein [Rickettsiaceae bacterium]
MSQNNLEKKILSSLVDEVKALGYNIVTFRLVRHNKTDTIVMTIEKESVLDPISVNDCRLVSKLIRNNAPVADLLGEFGLEVSSVGTERPLMSLQDYKKFIGKEAKIQLLNNLEGQKRYKGVIMSAEDDKIFLSTLVDKEKKIVSIPLENIERANLIFTEEMFKLLINKSK